MKKHFVALTVFCLLLTCFFSTASAWYCSNCETDVSGNFCSGCGAKKPSVATSNELFSVQLIIECNENWFFSTYDVDVYLDEKKIGKVAHGKEQTFELTMPKGPHSLCFVNYQDNAVTGSTTFVLDMDEIRTYTISCYSSYIDITKESTNIYITAEQKALQKETEQTFPRENAYRAAIVAMTNAHATDVFKPDRNTFDTSKFHDYCDYSGFFLGTISEGTWWVLDGHTWHVKDIILIMSGTGTHIKASMDVGYSNNKYHISNVITAIGSSLDDLDDTRVCF